MSDPLGAILKVTPSQLRILGSVALAMLLRGAIGLEREAKDKPAGLRTHMLVAGAAAFLVALLQVLLAIGVTVLILITLPVVGLFWCWLADEKRE